MSKKARKSNFQFLRAWSRDVFQYSSLLAQDTVLRGAGVYILYKGTDPYYVGKATSLFKRLHKHATKVTSKYYPHWTHFSAFAFRNKSLKSLRTIALIEDVLITGMSEILNSSTPRWPKYTIPKQILREMNKAATPKAMAARAGS